MLLFGKMTCSAAVPKGGDDMGVSVIGALPAGLWAVVAGLLALGSGAFLGDAAYQMAQRRRFAAAMLAPTKREQLLLRLQRGFRPLRSTARRIMNAIPLVDSVCESAVILLAEQQLLFTKEALLSLLLAASLLSFALGWVAAGSPTFGIALACIVFAGTVAFVRNASDKRNLSTRERIPEALRTISMSFRSGHSLSQTLSDAAEETGGYLGHLFGVAADRIEMGSTPTEALAVMRGNPRVPELSFVAVALDVQHQSGGSIAPVLESATDAVEGELRLMRALRVQTAQAKLSASIVTVMPFVLVALFSLMSPDFLSPFFSSFLGMALLALALVMQFTGVIIVRRMLKVDLD